MTGEAREPRTEAGMDLLKLMERLRDADYFDGPGAVAARVEMCLDFLDRTLEQARAEERAVISYNLGLVAGEGYRQLRELQEWLEAALEAWPRATKADSYKVLSQVLEESRRPTQPIPSPGT